MTTRLKRRVADLASRQNRSLSSVAVGAIEEYLDRKEANPLLELVGVWKDEPADLVQQIRGGRRNRRAPKAG
jgi:hypothetical protein